MARYPELDGPILEVRGIEKSFPGIRALRGVHLQVSAGEILGLVGENGAGKSTLIKILGGSQPADAGEIHLCGAPVKFENPQDSMAAGIAIIHQELNLVPHLDLVDNLFLGREIIRRGMIDRKAQRSRVVHWLNRLGLSVAPETRVHHLSVSQQQLVEIAKALDQNARVLIMDEPTAALTQSESIRLHAIAKELKRDGLAILYVSHRLDEIFSLTDRLVIFRDGEYIDGAPTAEFTRREVIEKLVGRDLSSEFPPRRSDAGEVVLEVAGLRCPPRVKNFSMVLRRGEILGLTGMVGSGRTEALRILVGADPGQIDSLTYHGRDIRFRSPRHAIENGVALLPEDRKRHGLVISHMAGENFLLPNLSKFSGKAGLVHTPAARGSFDAWVDHLRIRCSGWGQVARTLSGGNQQKIVLAKWLERDCEVLIFDEPTRGIDVGAKFEFYQWMRKLADMGKAILMISSDMEEVLGMSDRIMTMSNGVVSRDLINDGSFTAEFVLAHALGASGLAAQTSANKA